MIVFVNVISKIILSFFEWISVVVKSVDNFVFNKVFLEV